MQVWVTCTCLSCHLEHLKCTRLAATERSLFHQLHILIILSLNIYSSNQTLEMKHRSLDSRDAFRACISHSEHSEGSFAPALNDTVFPCSLDNLDSDLTFHVIHHTAGLLRSLFCALCGHFHPAYRTQTLKLVNVSKLCNENITDLPSLIKILFGYV